MDAGMENDRVALDKCQNEPRLRLARIPPRAPSAGRKGRLGRMVRSVGHNCVADPNSTRRQDLSAQSTFVHKPFQDFRKGGFCKMVARLAEPDSANNDPANLELPPREGVQITALGDDVSPGLLRRERKPGLPGKRLDVFS